MFQDIIYDGLIGQSYLRQFSCVTVSLPDEELIMFPEVFRGAPTGRG